MPAVAQQVRARQGPRRVHVLIDPAIGHALLQEIDASVNIPRELPFHAQTPVDGARWMQRRGPGLKRGLKRTSPRRHPVCGIVSVIPHSCEGALKEFELGVVVVEACSGGDLRLCFCADRRIDECEARRKERPAQDLVPVEAKAGLKQKLVMDEPGLRFDWDEVLRRPLFSPRFALVYSPVGAEAKTKISAGAGLYYDHTQLEFLQRALAGVRYDTYYAADGMTPVTGPLETTFQARPATLHPTRAINWSLGVERKLPWNIYGGVDFLQKRMANGWVYQNVDAPGALSGTYLLSDRRHDRYTAVEVSARRTFANGYTLFGSYTRSSARTNAAIDYMPAISLLGPQQKGPLAWDTPNRVVSWGWLPFFVPWFRHNWDFVYTLQWQSGFPYTSINANRQVVGPPGSKRFPDFVNFSPGLEWRFHIRGAYFGLRGVLENATGSQNPAIVNNVIDSPAYGTFSQPMGRALTARIRLISQK